MSTRPPVPGARRTSTRVLALIYKHEASAQRKPYKHDFGAGVEMWALPNGDVLLRGARGQPLHGDFIVPESE